MEIRVADNLMGFALVLFCFLFTLDVIKSLKTGSSRIDVPYPLSLLKIDADRSEEPIRFWIQVCLKGLGAIVAFGLFVMFYIVLR